MTACAADLNARSAAAFQNAVVHIT
jgi:hypothetical protein